MLLPVQSPFPPLTIPSPLLRASKCNNKSEQTLPLLSHTCIQYAYSLVWSGSVNRRRTHTHRFSSSLRLVSQSVFIIIIVITIAIVIASIPLLFVSLSVSRICLSRSQINIPLFSVFYIRLPLPRLLSCSQLLLQHFPHLC